MISFHRWGGSSFSCSVVGCGWTCSKDMHCISNHRKSCHPRIVDVPYELVEATGVCLDQHGMHSQSCLLDLDWHLGCRVKLARSKKSKAGNSGLKIISDVEKEEAKKLALKRVQEERNGDAKRIRLDLTSDAFLQDILKSAGDKGFNCLAEKVLELFGTGAVEVKSLLMGCVAGRLCRTWMWLKTVRLNN